MHTTPNQPNHDAELVAAQQTVSQIDWVQAINNSYVYEAADRTRLDTAKQLSHKLNNHIYFKREDLQPVYSFKIRGAYHCVKQLQSQQPLKAIICASAGNHAQGVAYAGRAIGVNAYIVMPVTTPSIKVDAVKALDGQVILHGDTFDQANAFAKAKAVAEQLTFIPPYDHPEVIVGQGTIGKEIIEQLPNVDYVFAAVGGGGLIAGLAAYLSRVAPQVKLVAVEYESSACLAAAMQAQSRVVLPEVGLFADGVAVAQIGAHPFAIVNGHKAAMPTELCLHSVVTCSTDEICAAIKDVYESTRNIVEPAGALSLAGIKKYCSQNPTINGKHMVAVLCGANMNFERLRYITERTELGEKTEAIFAVTIPEQKGAFLQFCRVLKGRGISEFNYRYAPGAQAQVFVGVKIKDGAIERNQIMAQVQAQGQHISDLTDDEVAKLHIRHLIGGHAALANERVYRIEFPERPGALLMFLEALGTAFNISLFHYRNHGAAEGMVLVGLQVPPTEQPMLAQIFTNIGYQFSDVTSNIGYQTFLR